MKQSIPGHSFRRRDGRTAAGLEPQRQEATKRQNGEAVKCLFPSGWRGYEVVWNGAKSDSSTSKLASGVIQSRNGVKCFWQNKKQTEMQTLITHSQHIMPQWYAIMEHCHLFLSSSPCTHRGPTVCRRQIFILLSPRSSQKSHYLCHPNQQ